jgi:hypothetical protein
VLVTGSAIIHLHLWFQGYRHIPTIGGLFLAQGVVGFGVAAGALAIRRRITGLAGAVYLAATSASLLLSATIGLFHFHDGLDAPYAGLALAIQLVGLVLFGLAAVFPGAAPSTMHPANPSVSARHNEPPDRALALSGFGNSNRSDSNHCSSSTSHAHRSRQRRSTIGPSGYSWCAISADSG